MAIRNVVFDIGNVLVRWAPQEILAQCFPSQTTPEGAAGVFRSALWKDLNKGMYTESEFIATFCATSGVSLAKGQELMQTVKGSLIPIPESFELVMELHKQGTPLFGLTDNVREIMAHLRRCYPLFKLFKGITVSAEVGVLKPDAAIYQHLVESNSIQPNECIFFDDMEVNVTGAKSFGMASAQFVSTLQAREDLRKVGLLP